MALNGLDLFSGIGGLSLALEPWVRPIAYCENDRYAQAVLLSKMHENKLPIAPIWDDIRTLQGGLLPSLDIIYGGFPCQDISTAGRKAGLEGERSGLFFEVIRLIEEIKPAFVFLENVPAIRTRGAERVGKELASRGYDCRWDVVSAQEVGACHIRKRWFLLGAHANGLRLWKEQWEKHKESSTGPGQVESNSHGSSWSLAQSSRGLTKPSVDRTGDGIPHRVDRHRGLGNSVVPLQAQTAFKRLMGL